MGMKTEQQIFIIVMILLLIGMIMLFSSSSFIAYQNKNFNNDPFYFFRRQFIFIIIGIVCLFIAKSIPLQFLKRIAPLLIIISIILLFTVLLAGKEINGARRWFKILIFTFQPSELAEISMIIFLARIIPDIRNNSPKQFAVIFIMIVSVLGLIFVEPNISSALLMGFFVFIMFLMSDISKKYILIPVLSIAGIGAAMIPRYSHAMARLMSFVNKSPVSQQTQASILAMGNGGFLGEGLGMGKLKLLYIPEAYSDFIFSIIGEELGFLGGLIIILVFFFFFYTGMNVAKRAYSPFNKMLAYGITFFIVMKAFIHIAISLKLLPTTGLGLPFISYGGSSILMNMIAVGLLINIAKNEKKYA